MPSQLHIILSYRTMTTPAAMPPAIAEKDNHPSILPLMRFNFRMCFWRVFDRIWRFDTGDAPLTVFGLPATLAQAHLYEARALKGAGISQPDYVLVATLTFEAGEEVLEAARSSVRQELTSRQFAELYEGILRPSPIGFLFDHLVSELPGHSSWAAGRSGTLDAYAPHLGAFYHYGWILALRVDRGSIQLDLSTREIANASNTQQILTHRMQLIQIQRYFLNEDRSNNGELRKLCARLREKYKLEKRFTRLSELHRAMESHLDNTFKVLQSKTTRTTNLTIQALTFSGLPLAIASVLFTVDLASSIFSEFGRVLGEMRLYLILMVSFAIPFVIVGLAMFIDRLQNRSSDS